MKHASRYLCYGGSVLSLWLILGCAPLPDETGKNSELLGRWEVESHSLVFGHDSVFILHVGEDGQLSLAGRHKDNSVVEANVTEQNIEFTWERRPEESENTLWKWTVSFEGQLDSSTDTMSGKFKGIFFSPYCPALKHQDRLFDECEPTETSGMWTAKRV